MKRIVIVGGVAGGASAAARLRRLDESAEIIMFERGEHVSYANCGLPYYVGGAIATTDKLLVQTPQTLRSQFNIDVRIRTEVTGIDRAHKTVTFRTAAGEVGSQSYDALILSPGATPSIPPIPGVEHPRIHTVRTIADAAGIKALLAEGSVRQAVVVGGGFIGLEMAGNLVTAGAQVKVVEMTSQVLPAMLDSDMAALLHQHLRSNGVELLLNQAVTRFTPATNGSLLVELRDGTALPADLVILCAGVRPETALAKLAGLKLGPHGGIAVDPHLRTSDPNIYAVGDVIEVVDLVTGASALVPLAGPANKQGRLVAENICGRAAVYQHTQGTAIIEVLGLVAAGTGATEATLQKAGLPYQVSLTHSFPHATYYPGGDQMAIKLLWAPDGKLLGAQIVGSEGVDKRIDVLATALHFGATTADLAELELAYAPPFSAAKDPVNIAAFVAENTRHGDVRYVQAADVPGLADKALLLDLREEAEYMIGTIPGSINIPFSQLRQRISEIPKQQTIVAFCRIGRTAYIACRMLRQMGFTDVYNLAGGYRMYSAVIQDKTAEGTARSEAAASSEPAVSEPAVGNEPAYGVPCCGSTVALNPSQVLDCTGLACPGPITRVHEVMKQLPLGALLEVLATDKGFTNDIRAWCQATGNTLLDISDVSGRITVRLRKGGDTVPVVATQGLPHDKTIVVFSGDLDKLIASFVIATGAAAMGRQVTMFFTFWGLNALRRSEKVRVRKGIIDRMFGLMMPRGSRKLGLSRMNMGGAGAVMIRRVMQAKGISSVEDLMAQAQKSGVRIVACQMSMDVMGIKQEELIPGVEIAGVATYLAASETADTTLFI